MKVIYVPFAFVNCICGERIRLWLDIVCTCKKCGRKYFYEPNIKKCRKKNDIKICK